MKQQLLRILFLIAMLFATEKSKAQFVTIPDPDFVAWLNTHGYAGCMNGNMMDTTCGAVVNTTVVGCPNSSISNLTGIEYFDSLKYLYCDGNQLTSMPTLPSSLNYLNCEYNQLTSLSALPISLIELVCYVNQLTSLPALPSSLILLQCSYNQITSLPALPDSLIYLGCYDNQLANLPALPSSLKSLICYKNQLTSLPALPNSLIYLQCYSNQLTSLPALPDSLFYLYCYDNPNLYCLPKLNTVANFRFDNTGIQCLPNVGNISNSFPNINSLPLCDIINTHGCSVFWNIGGYVYNDTNWNCFLDSNETKHENIKLNLYENEILAQSTYTDVFGHYAFDTDTGLFTISVDTSHKPFIVTCPLNGIDTAFIDGNDTMKHNRNFAIDCMPGFDIGVKAVARDSGIFRPANFAHVKILAGDMSNQYGLHCVAGISGAIQIIIDGPATYITTVNGALTPALSSDTLTYNIADFGTVDFNNDFHIRVQTDTTANLGEIVCFSVNVSFIQGDIDIENNSLTHCFTVVNSYDPNLKSVSPVNNLSINDKKLTYTIQFQNTGNAPAQHIFVMDTLDASLDISTFELLAYSHQPQVQLIGNNLRFNFPNINLPDSTNDEPNSHGYVQFSIKLKDSLSIGTIIKNTSYIYFDFNPPVQTNSTINTIIGTGFNFTETQNNISIYPNPTNNSITIATNIVSNNGVIKLYDMLGKELKTQKINSHNAQMNLQEFSVGNYILKIFDGGSLVGVKRVVKM